MSTNLARIPTFIRDLADVASRVLVDELRLDSIRADEIGLRIALDTCAEHAGELLYIASGHYYRIDERDREMYAFYTRCGRDVNKVAARFERSTKTVYRRIQLVEATIQAELQGVLFEDR